MADDNNIFSGLKEQITVPRVVLSILCSALVLLGGFVLKSVAGDIEDNTTKIEQKVDNETLKQYIERDKERFEIRQKTVDDKFDEQQKAIDDKLDLILQLIKEKE